MVVVFENGSEKHFLIIGFCVLRKKIVFGIELWKTVFVIKNKKKKTCLVELIIFFFK